MNIVKNAVIAVCLITSVSAQAQKKQKEEKTIFIPPVIVKDEEAPSKSEAMKNQYKSKQWRQGTTLITEESKGEATNKQGKLKKPAKPEKVPAPPPPAQIAPPPPPVPSGK
jgi:hypothetical protein